MKICSLCGSVISDNDAYCSYCGEKAEDIIFTNEDVNRRNMLLKQNAKLLNAVLSDKLSIILLILAIVIVAVAFVTAKILNKTNDISKKNAEFAPIESSVVEQPTVIQTQPKSGEIYLDVFADKGSEGIFTNELDTDVIVSCFYPKTGETVLEFYLRQGDTITMDMPYASLVIYAKDTDGNELFAVTDKAAFALGQSVPITISQK